MNNIIDLHCDTISELCFKGGSLRCNQYHLDLKKMQSSGYLAQCFALFTDIYDPDKAETYHTNPWDLYHRLLDVYKREISENSDIIAPALKPSDILENSKKHLMSSILTIEDGALLDNDIDRVTEIFNDGVRLLTLTWNYKNSVGYPNHPNQEIHGKGLKEFGIRVVQECNRYGILIDVSHLSEGGFYDVAKYSDKPFLASHSCCRNLCNHQRNLDDNQLRTIADKGGIVGLNFYSQFLKENETNTYTEDIIRHMKHIYNVCGVESLAWGSDFDGIDSVLEFKDSSGFPIILNAMERIFSEDEIEKINYINFLRVWSSQNI